MFGRLGFILRFELVFLLIAVSSLAQVSVLTQHNDLARTGQNLDESVLNTSNVNVSGFGKLFWRTVDGQIYAQPLYVPGLSIGGKTRNVVYVATEHNTVYAFDADDPAQATPLWQINLGTTVPSQDICTITGNTNPQNCPYLDINSEIGITSTPVIDSDTGIMYVVTRTRNSDSSYHFFLHALDIKLGSERLGGPAEIMGQVIGNGPGNSGGVLVFNPVFHLQRAALLLLNGVVYVAFGAVGDIGTFHGWIMGYDATTLQQTTIFGVSPNGEDGGIWQSGAGLVADASSNIYAMTGNGSFDANSSGKDYGDSVLKLSTSNGLAVTDYFTPSNQAVLFTNDTDLGSGGPMLIPGTSLVVGIGKDKIFRVMNTGNMGKFNSGFDGDAQEFTATTNAYLGSPVFWDTPNNGPVVYVWAPADFMKGYALVGGQFQTTPVMQSTVANSTGFANTAAMSVSANDGLVGSGIVWGSTSFSGSASRVPVPGILRAFDATNLTELWDSKQNPARDDVGLYAKWTPPTIANGKVYVPTFSGQLLVYGLNPPVAAGIQFVQSGSATPGGTTASVSASYTAAQIAGNLNVVVVSWKDSTSTIQSVTDSLGNVYSLAIGPTTGTAMRQSIYYAKNIQAGTNSVAVSFNQAAASPDVRILEYRGVDTVNPLDVSIGAAGNSAFSDSGLIATHNANELIVGGNITNTQDIAAGSPLTSRVVTSTSADIVEDRVVNVVGSYHAWAPLLTATPWVMQMVAFKAGVSSSNPAPTVSTITPNNGPTTGGTPVTIAGTGFLPGATVNFGGTAATGVTVVSGTSITATSPAHNVGAVSVAVTNTDGQSASLNNGFTYTSVNPAPTVTAIAPTTGTTAGGTPVTITGTGFLTGATVSFGGTAATGVTVVSGTSITATSPAHASGAVNVVVTNSDGQNGTLTIGYTYKSSSGGGGTIGFVQVAAATPQTASMSVAVTYPAAQTAGNLNVVVVGWDDTTSSVTSVTDSRGNAYTLAAGPVTGTGERQSIYYAKNIAAGSNTVTAAFDHAAVFVDVRVLEYSGLDTANPLDVTAQAAGAGTSANSGAATTTSANELIVGAGKTSGHFNAAGTNFTSRIITSPDGDIAEDSIVTSAGSYSAIALGTSSNWVMQLAAFKASGQGGTNPAPTVRAIAPTTGTTAGGTPVTISGTGFLAGATVSLGGTAATGVTVVSGISIAAISPAHAAGAVNVVVANSDGQSGTLPNGYTYTAVNPAPTVTSIAPTTGSAAGGTPVTITGTGFLAGATVNFGGTAAAGVTVVSGTSITATSPAHAAGTVNVVVTNSDGQGGTLPNGYTYTTSTGGGGTIRFVQVAAGTPQTPSMSLAVTYPAAQTAGNLNVVVVGWDDTASSVTSVTDTAGNTYTLAAGPVTGTGGRESIYYAKNIVGGGSNTVTAAFDHAAVFVDVRVLEYSGLDTANPLDVTAQATGSGTSASSGAATTTSANELIIGAGKTSGRFTAAGTNFTSRIITSPDGDIAEDRIVTSAGSYTATGPVTSSSWVMQLVAFKASGQGGTNPAPTVTSITPTTGTAAGGTPVTIAGMGFLAGATVSFGGTAATGVTVVSGISITATSPAHAAGAVNVVVTNSDGQIGTLPNGYTYTAVNPAPTVTSIAPTTGTAAGGTPVTITGTGFLTGATVSFGGTAATGVTVVSGTSITTTTPAHAAGAVNVAVTNSDGQIGTLPNGYTYTAVNPAPTVTSITPTTGSAAGGTPVTITGTGFLTGATVSFGGTAATGVTVVSGTSITATSPAHAAGAVNVVVTNSDGQIGTLPNGYTYTAVNPAPTVTSITPTTGTTAGGTPVTIAGTGFLAGATVSFGGTAATGVTLVSGISITATSPAHAAGAVNVVVTNSDGQAGTLPNGYTYTSSTGGGGTIRFVQVAAATPQTPSMSVAVTYPAAQTAGNLNVVVVGWDDTASSVTSVTDSRGNAYTLAAGPVTGTGGRESIYYAKNIAAGSNTVTAAFDHAAVFVDVRVLEYSGLDTANPLDVTAQAVGSGTSASSGAASTTSANELIVGAGKTSGRFTAAGTGYTSRIITSPDGDIAEDRIVTSAGSYTATGPVTSSSWVMQLVAFKAQQ